MGRNKEFDYEQKLDIALELFWTQGYHVTSITDLEREMRINRSSIYPTYGDKKELLIKCLTKYLKGKVAEYAAITGGANTDAIENLRRMFRLAVDQSIREGRTCLAVKMAFEISPGDEDVRRVLLSSEKKIEGIYYNILLAGQAQGSLRNNVDAKLTADFFAASSSALFKNYALNKNRKAVYDMIENLISMVKA
ncbi:TetR/AcrR family transcriptional regulator [Pedobacter sp. MC2016-05]|uniref:TetR/AcrR family transcriptional regulator n=1 Tax=Pedobacter sp. MC2016-05 TaxID=2994474 RepID=UPI002246D689|nr:TetR/AcrR family transcriptional regulator [Pedobacter sp. MC2016-05]MCX2475294.1 TetR/AcrR family transcriptional regulator [Pedobacter sp. MC2016-05]